ncbi:isoquinoline 1-oxidoreductase alpha subunit [Actimicrobium sp. GrIS 1.19]|jgi:isoquinoline 1-oxidoreductase alpha subunit|uniref:(2Fe-2S)-binding protein n=1 Tax=Actimicrobium sp. GrIS 1.19 TaxID=3071708 RepID=UPI002E03D16D|nr:isoquinoline 1-oxidoreductase alpha subunit [Actimicrobium sp. GrIS 1.19]
MNTFTVNGKPVTTDVDPVTPLLWVIRDEIGLKGTKFGCGIGMCGACTVHVDGRAIRSCITPVASVAGAAITTIEGLAADGAHPLQQAWIETQAPQCGYCQSGQIMQAATLLKDYPEPTDANIDAVMSGNLCRCMAYVRIRKAIKLAAEQMKGVQPHA